MSVDKVKWLYQNRGSQHRISLKMKLVQDYLFNTYMATLKIMLWVKHLWVQQENFFTKVTFILNKLQTQEKLEERIKWLLNYEEAYKSNKQKKQLGLSNFAPPSPPLILASVCFLCNSFHFLVIPAKDSWSCFLSKFFGFWPYFEYWFKW